MSEVKTDSLLPPIERPNLSNTEPKKPRQSKMRKTRRVTRMTKKMLPNGVEQEDMYSETETYEDSSSQSETESPSPLKVQGGAPKKTMEPGTNFLKMAKEKQATNADQDTMPIEEKNYYMCLIDQAFSTTKLRINRSLAYL